MAKEMFKEIKGKTRARYGFAMIATKEIKNISLRLLEIGEILARTLSCVTNKCKLIHRRLTFVRPKRQFRK